MKLAAFLLITAVALGQAPKPERIVVVSGGLMSPSLEHVTSLLEAGWTVKHVMASGETRLVFVLLPPSAEWEALAKEEARLKREAAAAARQQKATATPVEKGKQ